MKSDSSALPGRRMRMAGFSLPELLLVLFLAGLILGVAAMAWHKSRGRVQTASAARLTKVFIHRARMQAIYRGLNHFVVLDPDTGRLALYVDAGSTDGVLDSNDELVASTHLAEGVALALPATPSLPNPLGGGTLSTAWSFPSPSGGVWQANQRGMMVTPRGVFRSAEATPQNITAGTIVFSTPRDDTAAVTIRGTLGAVRAFEYLRGGWAEM